MTESTVDTRMRDFRLLMIGRTLSLVGASMTGLAMMLLALDLSGSATVAGGVAAAITLGALLMALPAGALVDRMDRKRTMVVSAGTLAVALLSVPIASLFGVVSLWHLVVVSFLVGCLGTFYDPAETASVKRLVPADRLGVAVTVQQVRGSIGNLLGGPLAGALFGIGRFIPLIGDAIANIVAAVFAGMVQTNLKPVSRDRPNVVKDAAEGISWLLKSPGPRTVALVAAVNMFGIPCLMTGVTLGLRVSGQPATVVGLVQTVLGAALLVGSLLTPRIQKIASLGRIFLVSSALQVVLTFLLLWARQPVTVFVVFGLLALTGPPSPISLRALGTDRSTEPDQPSGLVHGCNARSPPRTGNRSAGPGDHCFSAAVNGAHRLAARACRADELLASCHGRQRAHAGGRLVIAHVAVAATDRRLDPGGGTS